jgi:hypothetical protein
VYGAGQLAPYREQLVANSNSSGPRIRACNIQEVRGVAGVVYPMGAADAIYNAGFAHHLAQAEIPNSLRFPSAAKNLRSSYQAAAPIRRLRISGLQHDNSELLLRSSHPKWLVCLAGP